MAESNITTEKKVSKPKASKPEKVATAKPATETKPAAAKKVVATNKPVAAKKPAAAKSTVKKPKASTADLEQRYRMIEVAAYFIAEKDGFAGNAVDYWIAAEAEISQSGT